MTQRGNPPAEVQAAIEDLLRLAAQHKVVVAGFAFCADPASFVNFGNCSDSGDIALYAELCSIADDKVRKGEVRNINPGMVQ